MPRGYAAVGRDYLACSAARGRGTCSNACSLRRSELERPILEALEQRLMDPALVEVFIEEVTREINAGRATSAAARAQRVRELA